MINTDGTGLTRLTKGSLTKSWGDITDYSWSRDGTKLFFEVSYEGYTVSPSAPPPGSTYYEVNADGSKLTKVPNGTQIPLGGDAPPECKKISFIGDNDIILQYPDGRETQITHSGNAYRPVLSPDCNKIAFQSDRTPAHRPG